ncbi:MAG TPA: WecB/TagA/CpsF family glycosyltransferase [Anaeromyxobacter sp.]|nr:WecB/TagA/CpsF family glycosyltransferase [Anaeromyxobacter sp.]
MQATSPTIADPPRRLLRLGAVPIDQVTFAGALEAIEALVARRRGGVVVTPNVDHVVIAERLPGFRAAYAAADLSLADGKPIVWASHLLGAPLPEKISGSDLVLPLMDLAAARGWRVFLLGAGPGVGEAAAGRLRLERRVNVVGTAAPRISLEPGAIDESEAAILSLRAADPQLVLVAFGAPKQELWMHRHRDRLAPAVLLGVGASLDFVAGRVRRAPRWVSRAGLEWLWRLLREPRRLWRRYLVEDPRFLAVLWRTMRERRRARP